MHVNVYRQLKTGGGNECCIVVTDCPFKPETVMDLFHKGD